MSGQQRRASDSSQTSNSPLLPRSNSDGERGWRDVLENRITWAWYTSIMSTGGVALILRSLPFGFHGLWILGGITYIASLVGFLLLLVAHLVRFICNPRLIPRSIAHPYEGLFVSTFAGALGILIVNGATYADKMHTAHGATLRAAFWVFLVVAIVFGVGTPLVQLSKVSQGERESTPLAMQMILPLALVGYAAAAVVAHVESSDAHLAAPIIYAGIVVQGMGILVSLLYLSPFLDRLQRALPSARNRPSLFIAVGAPAFSSLSFALLAEQSLRLFHPSAGTGEAPIESAALNLKINLCPVLLVAALSLWGLSAWLFMIALAANLSMVHRAVADLQMFALVFPNAGFALASLQIAAMMGHPKALDVAAEVLALAVVAAWVGVVVAVGFSLVSGRMFRA